MIQFILSLCTIFFEARADQANIHMRALVALINQEVEWGYMHSDRYMIGLIL